jgi:hypothetical protein
VPGKARQSAPGVNERETFGAAIGGLHPRHLDAALASPHIARRFTWLSSRLRSVKLAPAVRIDRVGHDFAGRRRHKLNAGRTLLVVFWCILIFGYFVSYFGLSQNGTNGWRA